jgi:hypothetical protein
MRIVLVLIKSTCIFVFKNLESTVLVVSSIFLERGDIFSICLVFL